jgi:heterodisulfide reductase subunit C
MVEKREERSSAPVQIHGGLTREPAWVAELEAESGIKVSACYQCKKCSNGCPVVYAMDFQPNRLIRMIQLGLKEDVLKSATIWVCASCETCSTRCPNDIDIAALMDHLRQAAIREGKVEKEENTPTFHQTFLSSIRRNGRVHELMMIGEYRLKTKDFLSDLRLGWEMFRRGRLKLFPAGVKSKGEIEEIFKRSEREERR